ncbi:hypothetical protein B0H14DRAFT_3904476, partial [Mycena olivaceomarginata]
FAALPTSHVHVGVALNPTRVPHTVVVLIHRVLCNSRPLTFRPLYRNATIIFDRLLGAWALVLAVLAAHR